jgi:excisionase family DNA binding protein
MPSEMLNSIDSTAQRLGVSAFTIRRLIQEGGLRSLRVGRRRLVPESEVARVLTQGCQRRPAARPEGESDGLQ